jgi:hypothetical protein
MYYVISAMERGLNPGRILRFVRIVKEQVKSLARKDFLLSAPPVVNVVAGENLFPILVKNAED